MFEQGSPGKVSKDHKLSLSSVGREDRGDYICTAANTEGEAKQSLALNVLCKYPFSADSFFKIALIYCAVYI